MIDIVDIKGEVEQGKITAYVKDGAIYLRNDIGEIVKIGEVESEDTIRSVSEKFPDDRNTAPVIVNWHETFPEPWMGKEQEE